VRVFALILLAGTLPVLAQNGAKKAAEPAGPAPRTADGKASLSGVWEIPYTPNMLRGVDKPPFTAWGEQDFKKYDPQNFDYAANCLPLGWTRLMNTPMPMEIMQEPNRIAVLFEAWQTYKVIPTDGRDHPKDVQPTWAGNSVGHWEGDTLVIDTIGFNEKTRLDTIGHPHSDQLHTVERLTRTDAKHIAYEITVFDPKAYSEPIVNKRVFTLRPDWELMEYSCEENNKDVREGHIK